MQCVEEILTAPGRAQGLVASSTIARSNYTSCAASAVRRRERIDRALACEVGRREEAILLTKKRARRASGEDVAIDARESAEAAWEGGVDGGDEEGRGADVGGVEDHRRTG
jgi:hypothetical protein